MVSLDRNVTSFDNLQKRLYALRREIKNQNIDGFIVPRADEHQGEYVPQSAERLAWITGFTGSAGVAIVMLDRAAIFVDGRYTIQVKDEVPRDQFDLCHLTTKLTNEWIEKNVKKNQSIGFDPWLMTPNQVNQYRLALVKAGGTLIPVDINPVDATWDDRPKPPKGKIVPHDIKFSGTPSHDKRRKISHQLKKADEDAVLLSAPDSIAWLLNIRGSDLPFSPQPLSFGILHKDSKMDWFVDPDKSSEELIKHLGPDISQHKPEKLADIIDALGENKSTVRISNDTDPEWAANRLQSAGAKISINPDPCLLPKAVKSDIELDGMRNAHWRDGKALVQFLAWLDKEAETGELTEITAANYLEDCRRKDSRLKSLSFPTIAGSGPNGAICHYHVTEKSNHRLKLGSLFLVDSGGQYLDGTTDVTRTIPIGIPTNEMRENFTRVLRGHIAIATARFPSGTTGSQLDTLARRPLWDVGLDYDHGTGHGVGCYLNVHEGPHRISKAPSQIPLTPGMIISNEPGFYKPGEYGIRIENLVIVKDTLEQECCKVPTLEFETLTMAPIDRRLIMVELMEHAEIKWLNNYHDWVKNCLISSLSNETADWLKNATKPIS